MQDQIQNNTNDIETLQNDQLKLRRRIENSESKISTFEKEVGTLTLPLNPRTIQAINTRVVYPVTVNLFGTNAATAANYDVFFTADTSCQVVSISETHRVLGTDAGAVTLNVEKLTSGQTLGAGVNILTTALSLKTTINIPQYGVLANGSGRVLNKGDRLALVDSGTLTAVAGLVVTVTLKNI